MGVDVTITISGAREWDDEHRFSDDVARWLEEYAGTLPTTDRMLVGAALGYVYQRAKGAR